MKLAVGLILAIAFALVGVSSARGQGPDIRIGQLDCNAEPELVVIENQGDEAQVLTGWKLQSDPPDSEVFDLAALGGLEAGAEVFIQSGPSASGVFKWGLEFVFRDDDPTDYARIVDDTGAVVDQVNCGDEVAPSPTPTASPQPSPTPSPQPSPTASPESTPPGDVPNGGGPPPPSGDGLLAAMMVLVGGVVATAGVVSGAFSWLRLRSSSLTGTAATPASREAAARSHAQGRGSDASREEKPVSPALGLALIGLLATVVLFLLLLRHREA